MADEIMGAGVELAALVPEIWSKKLVPTLQAKLPFAASIASDYQGEIQALGDTVHISYFPNFDDAMDLAEDAVLDADSVTASNSNLVINHQIAKDYIVTSLAQAQSLEVAQQLGDLAMFSIMKKMQALIVAAIVPSASSPDHQIAYDSGTTLAQADILEAKELLDSQNVEENGRVLVCGALQLNDLFAIAGFTSRDYNPNANGLITGQPPLQYLGFQVKWTTEVGNVSYLFHPLFMQMAVQKSPMVGVYDMGVQGKRATRFNFTVLFGKVQHDNKRVVSLT